MIQKKAIILAGGTGSRLYPSTIAVSKQLMPIYDKPMIYYPIATLMRAGIRDMLIITTPHDQAAFRQLLGNGHNWGVNFEYTIQKKPQGIAQALIIGEEFLEGGPSALILGDNLFFGDNMNASIQAASQRAHGATIFGYFVKKPTAYGVVGFDENMRAISLEEKPDKPASNYAVTGLYFYDERASEFAKRIKPSNRNELEITALNQLYLDDQSLNVEILSMGSTWLDTGTHASLLEASKFVQVIENRQGRRICCPEIIAYNQGWIDAEQLATLAEPLKNSGYGEYLLKVLSNTQNS